VETNQIGISSIFILLFWYLFCVIVCGAFPSNIAKYYNYRGMAELLTAAQGKASWASLADGFITLAKRLDDCNCPYARRS